MTAEYRNCEATTLHNAFPHKFHKVIRNDVWPPTVLLITHILCNKERDMTAEYRNCEATTLHNAFPRKFHKVIRNDEWPPTVLLISHILCNKERDMTAEYRNCEATTLRNAFPHKFHKVIRNDEWPPTVLLITHILSTCCKLSAPEMHHLLAHDVRSIDLSQLTMNFDRRYALSIQKLYHRSHFTVSAGTGIRASIVNCCNDATVRTRGSHASAFITRRYYSITYTQSLHAKNCLLALGGVRNLFCGGSSYFIMLELLQIL